MRNQPAPVVGSALAGLLETGAGIYLVASIGTESIALFFLITGVCTLLLASQIGKLLRPSPGAGGGGGRTGEGGPEDGDDSSGGDGPGGTDPEWWPQFEAAFREYDAGRHLVGDGPSAH